MAKHRIRTLVVGLVAGTWACGLGAKPPEITEHEVALLPEYCRHTQVFVKDQAGYDYWRRIYGEPFHSFHHYCWGIIYLMRAARHSTSDQQRQALFGSALGEINYTLEHTPSPHELLPELLTRKGMVLRQLGRPKESIPHLESALSMDPKYWRAYLELSRCYVALGERPKAISALESGLKEVPDAKALESMRRTLGGGR